MGILPICCQLAELQTSTLPVYGFKMKQVPTQAQCHFHWLTVRAAQSN
jgi:hypothetical protein